MRRLNVKLFLYFLASLALLAGAVLAVHRLQASNISNGLLWQANQADKEGRPDQAARYLNRYLEFAPDDLETRARLGKTLADRKVAVTTRAREKARFVLQQVLTREPDRHDVRRCLVRLLLDARYADLAEEELKYLEKAQPGDPAVIGLRGQLLELRNRLPDALASLRQSVQSDSAPIETRVRLINLLRAMGGGRPGPHRKEAEAQIAVALQQAPDDSGVLLAASELAQERGDLKQARVHLDRALKLHGKDPQTHLTLARLELRENKRDKALIALREGLQKVHLRDRFELQWALANILVDGGDLEDARKVIVQIQDNNPSPGAVDYLNARGLMHQGRWFDASRLLENARAAFKDFAPLAVQADLLLASCYERLEEPARQLAACQRAAGQDPTSVVARQGIVTALWALGRTDVAIQEYRLLIKLNESLKAPVTGHAELARMLLLQAMQVERPDWRQVSAELDAAEKEQPSSHEVVLLRAELLAAQKKLDDAAVVLAAAIRGQPKRIEFWTAAAGLADRQGDRAKALQLLDAAQQQAGDSVELRLGRARVWAGQKGKESIKALRQLEEGLKSFTPDQQSSLLNGLAEANYKAGSPADAARLWRELTKQPRHARNLRLRLLLFDLALQQKDHAGMEQALQEIRTIEEGESPVWLFGQASRRLVKAREGDRAALDEARALLDKVVSQRPAWPAVVLARAELEELQGNVEQAITHYRRAIEQGVRSPRVIRQLVQLLTSRQRYDEALQELRKLRQHAPLPAVLKQLEQDLQTRSSDIPDPERLLPDPEAAKSKDYRDHLWRGQVLSAGGRRRSAEAEKAFRRAVELADTVPETWLGLVQYLTGTGQTRKAVVEVERAHAKLKGPETALALAQCFELAGKADDARKQYQSALEARPQDVQIRRAYVGFCLRSGSPREAGPHLRAIFDRKVKATEADVSWARRGLALMLASITDYKGFREALALVGLSLDRSGNVVEDKAPPGGWSSEDQVVRARVLATQSSRPLRLKAVALLEEIHKRQPLAPDDQLLLAQLYLGMGSEGAWWGKAREQMGLLVVTQPRNPTYLSAFAQALLQHGDITQADKLIANLEQVERARQVPLGSAELKAQSWEIRGKGEQALAVLKAHAEAADSTPDRLLLCAGLQARLGRVKEAVDLCEQARAKCPPEMIGGAGAALLRAARTAPGYREDTWRAQAARIEAWLKESVEKTPTSIGLRLQLADLLDLLGRADEGEPHFRAVLQRDPTNLIALNNLSWLLSRRENGRQEGLKLIQHAIDTHGARAELLDTRAVIYLAQGQTDRALADLEAAVADAPTPTKHFHLARAHHQARNTEAARQALRRATAAGLTVERVHPAEREVFQRLMAELK
ncbi:MAG: tetratricopeptide repeat protein [Gemmataceae bacterium]|nr:tetratricopeptide repeat protein [Gemmataceae bacterium]